MATILPVAKPLCLCDRVTISPSGKIDIQGVFNLIRAPRFPCVRPELTVYAQLSQGLGDVETFADIRRAADEKVMVTSLTHKISFPDRKQTRYVVIRLENVPFHTPGMYLVELLCDNTPVADIALEVAG